MWSQETQRAIKFQLIKINKMYKPYLHTTCPLCHQLA